MTPEPQLPLCDKCAGSGELYSDSSLYDFRDCYHCKGTGRKPQPMTTQPPLIGEKLDSSRDGVLRPLTTQPPGPEAVGTAEFERRVEEQGEADARLANIQKRMVAAETHKNNVVELICVYNYIGPNAKKILLDMARRLEKGAVQYGDFDGANANRDWDQETYEEHLDALVYQAVKRLRTK